MRWPCGIKHVGIAQFSGETCAGQILYFVTMVWDYIFPLHDLLRCGYLV